MNKRRSTAKNFDGKNYSTEKRLLLLPTQAQGVLTNEDDLRTFYVYSTYNRPSGEATGSPPYLHAHMRTILIIIIMRMKIKL